jgi:cellulose synthase/poly-beta-1,6-N-acetylglucosamine synthase-like glycosyltransferase
MVSSPGVSFVIPIHNGEAWIDRTLSAIFAQDDGRLMEIIAVDDGSRDRSREILDSYAASGLIKVLDGVGLGAASAINQGIRHASHPIICQVDQDVILHPGWLTRLLAELRDESVAAAQACYVATEGRSIWSRVMSLDLRQRYSQIQNSRDVDHVCTGNTAYRASALAEVGLLDETLGYGYDNDLSYRLLNAGFRLAICPVATSTHEWRDGFVGYLRQQYGFGYGRLDLVAKHRHKIAGDDVSRLQMMLHAPVMAAATVGLGVAGMLALLGYPSVVLTLLSVGLIAALVAERFIAGARAAAKFHDRAGFLFAPVHLVRDLAWSGAILVWAGRRLVGRSSRPAHSMHPRQTKTSQANRVA